MTIFAIRCDPVFNASYAGVLLAGLERKTRCTFAI